MCPETCRGGWDDGECNKNRRNSQASSGVCQAKNRCVTKKKSKEYRKGQFEIWKNEVKKRGEGGWKNTYRDEELTTTHWGSGIKKSFQELGRYHLSVGKIGKNGVNEADTWADLEGLKGNELGCWKEDKRITHHLQFKRGGEGTEVLSNHGGGLGGINVRDDREKQKNRKSNLSNVRLTYSLSQLSNGRSPPLQKENRDLRTNALERG